jgi:hypothetical protein
MEGAGPVVESPLLSSFLSEITVTEDVELPLQVWQDCKVTVKFISTESCELLGTGRGGRKDLAVSQRKKKSFGGHIASLCHSRFCHCVNSLMFPEV